MKIIYILLISFLFLSTISAQEKKCTWNILKSNCKTTQIANFLGNKVKQGAGKIGQGANKVKQGTKKILPKK